MSAGKMGRIAAGILATAFMMAGAPGVQAQFGQKKQEPKGPWADKSLSPDRRADLVIEKMTVDEKIQLLHGLGWRSLFTPAESGPGVRSLGGAGFIPGIPRLGIPDLQMSDAAVGVARGAQRSRYSTALPSGVADAASWDPKVAYDFGALIGTELRDQGFNMSLGGGTNLTREPRNGRTFEYEGEDPILAGTMVGQMMKAEQAQHVIGDIKHYAVNDQEDGRNHVNSIISERALRETDLLAFRIGIRDSGVGAVMCSYNMINGTYACENDHTLRDVLDHDWKFPGFVVSDWGGTHSTVKAAEAGLDIEMPGDDYFGAALKKAVQDGQVSQQLLDEMVHRVLRTEFATGIIDDPPVPKVVDVVHGFHVAQRVEEQGAVLLRNEDHQLPLDASVIHTIAVIGGHADAGVLSGGGSGQVDPMGGNAVTPPPGSATGLEALLSQWVYHRSVPLEAIRHRVPGAKVEFDPGTDPAAAAALAKSADVAIVFGIQHESEGMDLPNLSLPFNQGALIEAVSAANPHTIVVLETGGAVTMPWIDHTSAVLESWFPGIRGAQAIAAILFGDVNPSGKLPLTFPKSEADLPHPMLTKQPPGPMEPMPGIPEWKVNTKTFDMHYDEGLKVGYKWYDAENKTPLFPFGFGLSYTTFAYSDLKVEPADALSVSFTVKNTGERAGEEIAEVYAGLPANAQEPPRRLVGWDKVSLQPGESKTVTVHVEPLYLSIYDVNSKAWKLVPGQYTVSVGGSSRDLPLSSDVTLQ
jgi:beta-glucosidase